MENLKELNSNELSKINGGIVWKPFVVAGYLAYITYNEIVDFVDDFKRGYEENRN